METEISGHTLEYWKTNAEEDFKTTPISVLKYITILEELKKSNNIKVLINKFTNELEKHLLDTTKSEKISKNAMLITMKSFNNWTNKNCT